MRILRAAALLAWLALVAPRRARRTWRIVAVAHPRCASRILDGLVLSSVVAICGGLAVALLGGWTGPAVSAIAALGLPGTAGLYAGAVLVGAEAGRGAGDGR